MKKTVLMVVIIAVFTHGLFVVPAFAAVPSIYTNENFFVSEHDTPKAFWTDSAGDFQGVTKTGKRFSQKKVVSDIHVHLHSFAIDEARFYISSFGIIMAENDTVALSIYLARAGWTDVA